MFEPLFAYGVDLFDHYQFSSVPELGSGLGKSLSIPTDRKQRLQSIDDRAHKTAMSKHKETPRERIVLKIRKNTELFLQKTITYNMQTKALKVCI